MTLGRNQATGHRRARPLLPLEREPIHAWAIYVSRILVIAGICGALLLTAWLIAVDTAPVVAIAFSAMVAMIVLIPWIYFDLRAGSRSHSK